MGNVLAIRIAKEPTRQSNDGRYCADVAGLVCRSLFRAGVRRVRPKYPRTSRKPFFVLCAGGHCHQARTRRRKRRRWREYVRITPSLNRFGYVNTRSELRRSDHRAIWWHDPCRAGIGTRPSSRSRARLYDRELLDHSRRPDRRRRMGNGWRVVRVNQPPR